MKFNQLRDKLLKTLSFVEAKIDFPDEDIPDEYIKLDLLQIRYHIKGLCWYYSPEAKLLILSFNILSNADRRYQF